MYGTGGGKIRVARRCIDVDFYEPWVGGLKPGETGVFVGGVCGVLAALLFWCVNQVLDLFL